MVQLLQKESLQCFLAEPSSNVFHKACHKACMRETRGAGERRPATRGAPGPLLTMLRNPRESELAALAAAAGPSGAAAVGPPGSRSARCCARGAGHIQQRQASPDAPPVKLRRTHVSARRALARSAVRTATGLSSERGNGGEPAIDACAALWQPALCLRRTLTSLAATEIP